MPTNWKCGPIEIMKIQMLEISNQSDFIFQFSNPFKTVLQFDNSNMNCYNIVHSSFK